VRSRCSEVVSRAAFSEAEYAQVVENSRDFLPQSFTFAQERLVRVLVARAKVGLSFAHVPRSANNFQDDFVERLSAEHFLALSDAVSAFCSFCDEQVAGERKVLPLRSCLHALTLRFLAKFHDDRKTKLRLDLGR